MVNSEICLQCNMHAKQDEYHILLHCPALTEPRLRMQNALKEALDQNYIVYENLSRESKMGVILGNKYHLINTRDSSLMANIVNSLYNLIVEAVCNNL